MSEESGGITTSEDIDKRMRYKEIQPSAEGSPPKIRVDRIIQRQREVKVDGHR